MRLSSSWLRKAWSAERASRVRLPQVHAQTEFFRNVVSNSADQASKVVRDAARDLIVVDYTDDGTSATDLLTINSIPARMGQTYNLQRALTVIGPWSTLATPTAPLDGLIEFIDPAPPVGSPLAATPLSLRKSTPSLI